MQPRLYNELAAWWPLLSSPHDYEEEASLYSRLLREACGSTAPTLLELGSGGGNNAYHMRSGFESLTLTDVSDGMLAVNRALNHDCEHVVGDMRRLRLERRFDCVFVHDAIVYMASEEDLRQAMRTAFVHCRPGGAALFVPDHVRETFKSTTGHGGHDGPGSSLRYLQWEWDPDPADCTYLIDFVYLLREGDAQIRVEYDRHTAGLFSRGQWLAWLAETGFESRNVPVELSDIEPGSCEAFLCLRPAHPRRSA